MDGVILTPLKQIHHPKGDVFHGMKKSDIGYAGFSEAYFSTIHKGDIKGWKKHTKMTLNLIVITGEIEFVIFNGTDFLTVKLSRNNYQRLTVSPGLCVAFRGIEKENLLLNLADLEHDPQESINILLQEINYSWGTI
ncbi:MAG TPA: WxcM-like domain-containing protein [Sulfuricurvum sp.]|nr:MAG: dTDP-4-dehydrorhamnose 3,5-epimerase [Campylobacterales bacterium 16-40-21]OZA02294.1 MAG: dTDP-4-dehydrorhamnose 3,5-epimerase [Sulfuricurvum sp. 17-40-25]HQS67297.1 WxcM-like domain-containing protein [Sulfuricurvum sp.]HQT36683.1 WxcM-like domain-containing protein [Sulfuricurvum sp.]